MNIPLTKFVSILALGLPLGCSTFSNAASQATVSYPDGPRTYVIAVTADKTSVTAGAAATFKAKIKIEYSRTPGFVDSPTSLSQLVWTARSAKGDLLQNRDPRVQLNKAAGTLAIQNLTVDDGTVVAEAKLQINDFAYVNDSAEVKVQVVTPDKPARPGIKPPVDREPSLPPKPVLPPDFVHAVRGGGSFPAGSRVELTVAFKKESEGSKGVQIDWYLHGKKIRDNQAKLVIAQLDAAETGTYTAKVTRLEDKKTDQASVAVTLAKK